MDATADNNGSSHVAGGAKNDETTEVPSHSRIEENRQKLRDIKALSKSLDEEDRKAKQNAKKEKRHHFPPEKLRPTSAPAQ